MLVGAMKIGRQSLYDTFGDKWKLYQRAVDRYCEMDPALCSCFNSENFPIGVNFCFM